MRLLLENTTTHEVILDQEVGDKNESSLNYVVDIHFAEAPGPGECEYKLIGDEGEVLARGLAMVGAVAAPADDLLVGGPVIYEQYER